MSISKTYNPKEAEEKWYSYWLEKKFFRSLPDEREPYTIVIPPPNVTGVLHMGHMLNNTIQDVLIRRARMQGKNACWVPGTDHASIATEAKVVAMLKEKGIEKKDLSREEFLGYAYEWKDKYGGIILKQLETLGASCDWDRTRFTMEESLSEAVIDTFIHLYKKGWIYRGVRMVNWDPKGKTAVSDEEVIRKEVNQKLYYIKYAISGEAGTYLTIATTRPETIMADAAICVNPNDERYVHLKGKTVFIPLLNREIPVIQDEYVSMDFGTGCLKVTPAHDLNDYELGIKHKLPVIDILSDDGTLNEKAQILVGEDRFAARKKIAILLEEAGHLEKVEDNKSQLGYSERTDAVIEPKLSMQWFCKMDEMAKPALDYVLDGDVKLIPEKFTNTYKHWMENVKDWCISRQLWWGQQIPAYYYGDGKEDFVVAVNIEAALELAKEKTSNSNLQTSDFRQDSDTLDTWFSSWLWPISVFDGIRNPDNEEINYYYPTNDLVTGPDILFFWVARMIMAGHEYMDQKPFEHVYFTGIVRDKQGRKMSKSLGNSPDLLALIDVYGADAVRFGIMISSPAGNDILFDESALEQGRNFNNKLWNVLKLIQGWEKRIDTNLDAQNEKFAMDWFENRLLQVQQEVDVLLNSFKLSEALKTIYSLIWDDYCSWYLEWIKPGFEQPISKEVYDKTVHYLNEMMHMLHPFMPFITEEIYHLISPKQDDLCNKIAASVKQSNTDIVAGGELLKQVISALRDARNKNQLKPKDTITLHIQTANTDTYKTIESILCKQVNATSIAYTNSSIDNTIVVAVEKDKFFIETSIELDATALKATLLADLAYQKGFLESVSKKLSNERFVQNAKPDVVALEQQKQADAIARIATIEESLQSL